MPHENTTAIILFYFISVQYLSDRMQIT